MNPESPLVAIEASAKVDGIEKVRRIPAHAFKPGNPGRPKGVKNHSTRVREALLAAVGRSAVRRFKHRLNGASDPKQFEKAMDQVISLLGPSKPLVAIDQSKHTHFTLILEDDGSNPSTA